MPSWSDSTPRRVLDKRVNPRRMSPSIHEIPALTDRQIRLQDLVFCFHPLISLVLQSFHDLLFSIFSSENHVFEYIDFILYINHYLGNMGLELTNVGKMVQYLFQKILHFEK